MVPSSLRLAPLLFLAACSLGPDLPHPVASAEAIDSGSPSDSGETGDSSGSDTGDSSGSDTAGSTP